MINEKEHPASLKSFLSFYKDFDQSILTNLYLLITESIKIATTSQFKNGSLVFLSGPSPVISITIKDSLIYLDPASLVTLNKSRKKFPTLTASGKLLKISTLSSDEISSLIDFIIFCNTTQKSNPKLSRQTNILNHSQGSSISSKQFKLPRKSTGS